MGATHSFAESETIAFTRHVNDTLASDPDCTHVLPIAEDGLEIFEVLKDGVVLCKLINHAVADTVDTRCVHLGNDRPLSVYEVTENLNLAINAAIGIGCRVVNIGAGDIMTGSPHLVLGLLWQVVKAGIMATLNLKATPELIQLLSAEEGDDPDALRELLALPPEKVLLRWLNHQIRRGAMVDVTVKNFGRDLKDCTVYAALLTAVAPAGQKPTTLLADVRSEVDPIRKAQLILDAAEALGVTQFRIQPADIIKGNEKLNMGFMAAIFNALPGLDPPDKEGVKLLEAFTVEDDIDASREERAYKMWLNSLGLESHVGDLFGEARDGLLILRVMDAVKPGVVDWSKVKLKPRNEWERIHNCNAAIAYGKSAFAFSLVGIAGDDIAAGKKKLILALTWQLMRYHCISFLSSLAGSGGTFTEADVVAWANAKVAATGVAPIASLKDTSIGSGTFLLELIRRIEPRAVAEENVTPGSTAEERVLNTKYAISCARRLGCMVFLLYEDIVEVKPKMLLVFVATLMSYDVRKASRLNQ